MNNQSGRPGRRTGVLLASSLLVVGSMVGAWVLIEQSKTTEVFLVTKQNLASGTTLTAADLDQIPLSMFEISGSYLQPDALVEGLVLTRPLAAGEAVPVSALTTAEQTNWSNVVLTPALELSSQIEVGTKVSIWSSPHRFASNRYRGSQNNRTSRQLCGYLEISRAPSPKEFTAVSHRRHHQ